MEGCSTSNHGGGSVASSRPSSRASTSTNSTTYSDIGRNRTLRKLRKYAGYGKHPPPPRHKLKVERPLTDDEFIRLERDVMQRVEKIQTKDFERFKVGKERKVMPRKEALRRIFQAIQQKNVHKVQELLRIRPDCLDGIKEVKAAMEGRTPLHEAAELALLPMIKMLLAMGASRHERDHTGQQPKDLVPPVGCIDNKSEIDPEDALMCKNLLEYDSIFKAAALGDINRVDYLMSIGNSVDRTDYKGMNPLHYAALMGRTEMVEWLLMRHGADLHVLDRQGRTAFQIARSQSQAEEDKGGLVKRAAEKQVYYKENTVAFEATVTGAQAKGVLEATKMGKNAQEDLEWKWMSDADKAVLMKARFELDDEVFHRTIEGLHRGKKAHKATLTLPAYSPARRLQQSVISEGQALFKMERARDMEQIKKAWGMAIKGQSQAIGLDQERDAAQAKKGGAAERESHFNAVVAEQVRKQHKAGGKNADKNEVTVADTITKIQSRFRMKRIKRHFGRGLGHITSPRTGERALINKVAEKSGVKCQYCRRNRLDISTSRQEKRKLAKSAMDGMEKERDKKAKQAKEAVEAKKKKEGKGVSLEETMNQGKDLPKKLGENVSSGGDVRPKKKMAKGVMNLGAGEYKAADGDSSSEEDEEQELNMHRVRNRNKPGHCAVCGSSLLKDALVAALSKNPSALRQAFGGDGGYPTACLEKLASIEAKWEARVRGNARAHIRASIKDNRVDYDWQQRDEQEDGSGSGAGSGRASTCSRDGDSARTAGSTDRGSSGGKQSQRGTGRGTQRTQQMGAGSRGVRELREERQSRGGTNTQTTMKILKHTDMKFGEWARSMTKGVDRHDRFSVETMQRRNRQGAKAELNPVFNFEAPPLFMRLT